jgi:hypothetical protein
MLLASSRVVEVHGQESQKLNPNKISAKESNQNGFRMPFLYQKNSWLSAYRLPNDHKFQRWSRRGNIFDKGHGLITTRNRTACHTIRYVLPLWHELLVSGKAVGRQYIYFWTITSLLGPEKKVKCFNIIFWRAFLYTSSNWRGLKKAPRCSHLERRNGCQFAEFSTKEQAFLFCAVPSERWHIACNCVERHIVQSHFSAFSRGPTT